MQHESSFVHKLSDYCANGLLKHRVVILTLALLVTVFLGYQGLNQRLSPGFDKAIPLSHPYMKTFMSHRDEFGGANRVTVFELTVSLFLWRIKRVICLHLIFSKN